MLSRYTMHRGKRPAEDPLPVGLRQDTRKHTNHFLKPPAEAVIAYLADPCPETWAMFSQAYQQRLESNFQEDRSPFDQLAKLATEQDVYLGCSCPTKKNPNVQHCHTVLALRFMKRKYPNLVVVLPNPSDPIPSSRS